MNLTYRIQHYILFSILSAILINHSSALAAPQTKLGLSLDSFFNPISSIPQLSGSLNYTFSGPANDSIDYIELYLTADNQCKTTCQKNTCSPLAYTQTITTGTPIPYTTGGTLRSIPNASILAFLQADPHTLISGTYYIGMYMISAGKHCSSTYCSTSSDNAPTPLCIQASYTATGGGSVIVTQLDNGNAVLNKSTQYLYIPDSAHNNIERCLLNTDGTISNCLTAANLAAAPQETTFATVNETQYGYAATNGLIYRCTLTAGGAGALTCAVTTPTGFLPSPDWNSPNNITLETVDGIQYAYVLDNSPTTPAVYQCTLYPSTDPAVQGALYGCQIASYFSQPTGIAFTTIAGTQYAYVSDYNSKVYLCHIDTDNGTFTGCNETGAPATPLGSWQEPNGIAVTTASNENQYAYVIDSHDTSIYQCLIATDGTLNTSCPKATTFTGWNPAGITFGTVSGIKYAYISDAYAGVYQCTMTNTGAFGTCNLTPPISAPTGWETRGNVALPNIIQ